MTNTNHTQSTDARADNTASDITTKVLETLVLESLKEQRQSRRWRIFFRLIWLGLIIGIICLLTINSNSSGLVHLGKKVAVVDLRGVISEDNQTYHTVKDGLDSAFKDKDTVAVIIRANSPGGSPVYSDMLYHEILRVRKLHPQVPLDVVVEEVCASGCYYAAAAANKIYASPASIVGSIGVIYTGFGMTKLMDKLGVDSRLLISGKNKAMGYPFVPSNPEQTVMQQQMLDEIHSQFITAVKAGRGKRLHTNATDLFSGRYWIGSEALPLGLIDGYATVDSLARNEFHTDNIVNFTPQQDPLDKLAKKLGVGLADGAQQAVSSLDAGAFE